MDGGANKVRGARNGTMEILSLGQQNESDLGISSRIPFSLRRRSQSGSNAATNPLWNIHSFIRLHRFGTVLHLEPTVLAELRGKRRGDEERKPQEHSKVGKGFQVALGLKILERTSSSHPTLSPVDSFAYVFCLSSTRLLALPLFHHC